MGCEADTVVHRRAFAQHGAGHHAGTRVAGQADGVINGAVINHDHLCRGGISQRIGHHLRNAFCLVERRNHNRRVSLQWQLWCNQLCCLRRGQRKVDQPACGFAWLGAGVGRAAQKHPAEKPDPHFREPL